MSAMTSFLCRLTLSKGGQDGQEQDIFDAVFQFLIQHLLQCLIQHVFQFLIQYIFSVSNTLFSNATCISVSNTCLSISNIACLSVFNTCLSVSTQHDFPFLIQHVFFSFYKPCISVSNTTCLSVKIHVIQFLIHVHVQHVFQFPHNMSFSFYHNIPFSF